MSIQSSQIIEDSVQIDGRRSIREEHTDHLGAKHYFSYVAESNADVEAIMAARVSIIETSLAETEISTNMSKALSGQLDFVFQHSTLAQNRTALRELFRTATKWELMTLGWVIHELNLSDNQLKSLFGVNDAQLPALKAKLLDIHDKYEAALALEGQ